MIGGLTGPRSTSSQIGNVPANSGITATARNRSSEKRLAFTEAAALRPGCEICDFDPMVDRLTIVTDRLLKSKEGALKY